MSEAVQPQKQETEITTLSPVSSSASLASKYLTATLESLVARQLSSHTRKAYRQDAQQFYTWLEQTELDLITLAAADFWQYRRYLADTFARTTAARKLIVARKLLQEAVERGLRQDNPGQNIPGYKNETEQETPHTALTVEQARELLRAIPVTTQQGKRDYAIILLLLRTGLRRSECASLLTSDLSFEQGHNIALVRHGKGDKRRKIKIPVDVMRAVESYQAGLAMLSLGTSNQAQPLFVQFRRGDRPTNAPVTGALIERIVKKYAAQAGFELTPHGLRATFVTLALEGGAKLQQVQYAVGHADPRTTERYQKRKLNLDQNAVDFIFVNRDV